VRRVGAWLVLRHWVALDVMGRQGRCWQCEHLLANADASVQLLCQHHTAAKQRVVFIHTASSQWFPVKHRLSMRAARRVRSLYRDKMSNAIGSAERRSGQRALWQMEIARLTEQQAGQGAAQKQITF